MILSDVFISYSRADSRFVNKLNQRLDEAGLEVWIDWEDIPYSSNWWDEISQAIDGASAFVCVLSDDYFNSQTCKAELQLAEQSNKRIIPVSFKDFDRQLNTSNAVAKTNWLEFSRQEDFETALDSLIETLNTDLDWRKFLTRLQVRATEWTQKGNDNSYHLFGQDLDDAIEQTEQAEAKSPQLTTLQRNYIEASKAGAREITAKQLRGFYLAALAYAAIQIFVIYIWNFDGFSETTMIKLSWIWMPGLAFAVGGLVVGRYRMRNAFIVMAAVMALFALFYAGIWPML